MQQFQIWIELVGTRQVGVAFIGPKEPPFNLPRPFTGVIFGITGKDVVLKTFEV